MTICVKCKHFYRTCSSNDLNGNIWYNQFCKASPLPIEVDPITGEKTAMDTNDLGGKYIARTPYQHARNVNKGNCPLYEDA